MTVSAHDATPRDHRDRNDELFAARDSLLAQIDAATATVAAAEAGTVDAALAKRNLRKARRALDDNTNTLVEENIGLVINRVRRFTQTATPEQRADYEAAGKVGLITAINTYRRDLGTFSSWAWKQIMRNVHTEVHRTEHQTLGQTDFERRPAILTAHRALTAAGADTSPEAVVAEVARTADVSVTVAQVRRVLEAPRIGTLDAPLSDDGATAGDLIADSTDVAAAAIASLPTRRGTASRSAWPHLDARTRQIVGRRFGLDGTDPDDVASLARRLDVPAAVITRSEQAAVAEIGRALIGLVGR